MEEQLAALTRACWVIGVAVSLLFMVGCWITYTLLRGVNEIIRGISSIDEHLAKIAAERSQK